MAKKPRLATVLALDIGNTHVTVGTVRGEEVYSLHKLPADNLEALPALLAELWDAMDKPRRIVASSVNPAALERVRAAALAALEEPLAVVGEDVAVPLQTALKEPEKVGVDRLCAAAAAYGRLQQACVVVDLGTAVTIDCVDDEGIFRGGAILPGMHMQAAALHRSTAQLPEVVLRDPDWVFGRNTEEAIVGGIVYGVRGAVRERVEAYATELGQWPLVIFTGGDAELMKMEEGFVQATVPGLCLLGIALAFYGSLVSDEEKAAGDEEAEGPLDEEAEE